MVKDLPEVESEHGVFMFHSRRDEPYEFVLGSRQAIPAFEEAVSTMRVGGVRRIEVLGEIPSLSYPRDRSERFVSSGK
jgi:FKBP-type peptidyl-prolyl cis-trans isomerase 2